MKPAIGTILYRAIVHSGFDGMIYDECMVVGHTKKGYWVEAYKPYCLPVPHKYIGDKWIKRWAYPTKKEALKSRLARSNAHKKFLVHRLERVQNEIKQIKEELNQLNEPQKLLPAPK